MQMMGSVHRKEDEVESQQCPNDEYDIIDGWDSARTALWWN